MRFPRSSGLLLHPTSLPGSFGIGDLGQGAYDFADFLADCGQSIWQLLPLGPTGYGNSPYQCYSAFAGNPLLIDLEDLVRSSWLPAESLQHYPALDEDRVEFDRVREAKIPLLEEAYRSFRENGPSREQNEFEEFCRANQFWLDDYALFASIKSHHGGVSWNRWPEPLAQRRPEALQQWRGRLSDEIRTRQFVQYIFYRQWGRLRRHCGERGIRIMGDIPIFVAYDSADVWANRELFDLDQQGEMRAVAGVPPDYFSETGQLWGNPLYLWDRMANDGYRWWVERFRWIFSWVDIVRIDHFRGFAAYWEIPAGHADARHGRWVQGPGASVFDSVRAALGQELPVVAENLGEITPDVEELRRRLGFPGMAVLQFAFGQSPRIGEFLPHNYVPELVAYAGTHDNDTLVGWWESSGLDHTLPSEQLRRVRRFAGRYLGLPGQPVNWAAIRMLLASAADTVILTLPDLLGLGTEARLNLPGTTAGNWGWRFRRQMITSEVRDQLRDLTWCYGRSDRRPAWAG